MARPKTLSAAFARTIREPGVYGDGRGGYGLALRVRVTANGRISKTWRQRVRVDGQATYLGLGPYPLVSLAEARDTAFENARTIRNGGDPRRAAQPEATTVATALEAAALLKAPTWRGGMASDAGRKWEQVGADFVLPGLGHRPIAEITAADVLRVVAPLWASKRTTARRVLTMIRAACLWAVAEGLRADDPTTAALGTLPKNGARTTHREAPSPDEILPAIVAVEAGRTWWAVAGALRFLALTATRSGEVRGATWGEVDVATATWAIPGARTKTGAGQRVALSRQALAVLADAAGRAGGEPEPGALVFPPERSAAPLTGPALIAAIRRCGVTWSVHGLRSSFRSWAADQGIAREVAEQVLGHTVGGVEGAYMRSDMLERRRPVAQDWADEILPA